MQAVEFDADAEPSSLVPNPLQSTRNAASCLVYRERRKLWRAVFDECDANDNGSLERRELLVVMHRLHISIPPELELRALIDRFDTDEDESLDFDEVVVVVGGGGRLFVVWVIVRDVTRKEEVRSLLSGTRLA